MEHKTIIQLLLKSSRKIKQKMENFEQFEKMLSSHSMNNLKTDIELT